MNLTSFFIFNKAKNYLKKNNIELKDFIFFDSEKMILIIDNVKFEKKENLNEILKELKENKVDNIKELLITKSFIKIKMKDGKVLEF